MWHMNKSDILIKHKEIKMEKNVCMTLKEKIYS